MKITAIEDLHADGGWRTLSFLKITTDTGLIGWSEFSEGSAAPGLTGVILKLGQSLLGSDPRQINLIHAKLFAVTRIFSGGLIAQAIAALENACLDLKAKELNVPMHQLFGGALRKTLPIYWSQCGTLRSRFAPVFDAAPLRSLDDIVTLGQEAKARGFKALKTNILSFENGICSNYRPGFGIGTGFPELNLDDKLLATIVELLAAFEQGAGKDVKLALDLNFHFKPEGAKRIARALERFNLMWLEVDIQDPKALAEVKQSTTTRISSLETLLGRQALRPYLEANAADVAIIDPQWNGLLESTKMATMAESYEINVASHNYHGQLSSLMGAHFSAATSNFSIMEYVVDEAAFTREYMTHPIQIVDGEIVLPEGPGWGSDINEEAVRARPVKLLT